jgi:hypothetical protein
MGNSQFPRLVFHQQDTQPYGLHTERTEIDGELRANGMGGIGR